MSGQITCQTRAARSFANDNCDRAGLLTRAPGAVTVGAMTMAGKGVLAFWHDVVPGGDAEFDQWHLREHIPERVAVPGFLRCRRYVTLGGPPRYFYFYETESLDTLQSAAYLARLGTDPATAPVQKLVEALDTVDPILGGGVYFGGGPVFGAEDGF